MKKIMMAAALLALCSCTGTQGLGQFGNVFNQGNTAPTSKVNTTGRPATSSNSNLGFGNILSTILGNGKVSEKSIVGDWHYAGSSCVFESENMLKKAAGTASANEIERQLDQKLSAAGFNSNSCTFKFNSDKTFSGKIANKPISGTYMLDTGNKMITLNVMKIKKVDLHVAQSMKGISLLIEGDKLKNLLSIAGGLTGNASIKALTSFLGSYDGMLVGIELEK